MDTQTVTVTVDLTDEQAAALAQFVKRATLATFQANAQDTTEAYTMQAAAERLRVGLANAGHAPR